VDIRNMRQLLAVGRYGSIAKASEALGVSQPALSAAIARMEDQLGVPLFERSAQGSRLTPIGELVAQRARKVVAEAEQMIREAALIAGGDGGSIRVGVGSSLREGFLGPFLEALTESYPLLGICVDLRDRSVLIPMLRAREIDLAICAVADEVADDDLVVTNVLTTDGVAVARPEHPLAGRRRVSVAEFAEFASSGVILPQFTNREVLGLPTDGNKLLQYQSNDYEPLIHLALLGRSTLLAPAFVVEPYLRDGRLVQIELDWAFRVSFAALATRTASASPVVSRAIRHAAAVGAALQAASGLA
jgi:DNA-binding transcriptional LysR family regulator